MIIQPKDDFRLLGMGYNLPMLDKTRTYDARPATNQPDWEAKGKIFVSFHSLTEEPSILLERGDYEIIEP
jgi:hypothetical protein